jgi:putative endonuclease
MARCRESTRRTAVPDGEVRGAIDETSAAMTRSPDIPNRTPTDARRPSLGRRGEDLAAGFLAARGYQIVARNVRADRVELDLVVRRGDAIVFVEVKTRRSARHGTAAEAVDPRKQARLRRGARAWLAARPPEAKGARRHRFDVITCILLTAQGAPSMDPRGRMASGGADAAKAHGASHAPCPRNATSAPDGTRWSIEHWESAF